MEFLAGKFYVMDVYASTADTAYVAGPFDAREDAAKDASERNIAGDLQVYKVPARYRLRFTRPSAPSAL